VPLTDVSPGDLLRVKPGGRVPVDGIVVSGSAIIDESMLTGESLPVEVAPGHQVRAGTLNGHGSFDLRAEGIGSATLLAQIVALVAEAQRARAPVQDLARSDAAHRSPAPGRRPALMLPVRCSMRCGTQEDLRTWASGQAEPGHKQS
jgi:Cu+-exporting ATPase